MGIKLSKGEKDEIVRSSFKSIFETSLIDDLCSSGDMRSFVAETEIMDIGTMITHIPLVLSGSLKIMTEDKDENELLLYYLEAGNTCAVTLNCCSSSSISTVRAISETDVLILMIPVEKMDLWMVRYVSWRSFVLESYNTRLSEMVKAIDHIVFHSLEERLIKYLRDKAWILKSATLNVSHRDIANDLHTSRVVISRLMKKLEHAGTIRQKRNRITLIDFENIR